MKRSHSKRKEKYNSRHIHLFGALTLLTLVVAATVGVQNGIIHSPFVLNWVVGKSHTTNTTTQTTKTTPSVSSDQPIPTQQVANATPTTRPVVTNTPFVRATATPKLPRNNTNPTATPVLTPDEIYSSPPCPASAHTTNKFHTLYDPILNCHYDHEHGEDPFTRDVSLAFPGLNLYSLLGYVEIGHTNPSGPMENTHKHGGFKWQVQTTTPNDCALGFESAQVAINAIAMQYHAFGDYSIEFDSRIHSALALMRQCLPGSNDYGYVYTVQHVDYGQRVSGYQGDVIPYLDNPNPGYADGLAPYFTIDCIGRAAPPCGRYTTYDQYVASRGNASTTWTSKSSHRIAPSGSSLLTLLFRARDTYQILDWSDTVQPFKFMWLCSSDGGATYNGRSNCRHNNTTTRVHEVGGTIPATWDNLAGFDTDLRVGRITANGYTTRFGQRNPGCTAPGIDCHPLRLVNAYVGRYGSLLFQDKLVAFTPTTLPERDYYFCNGRVCSEFAAGARPSGWVSQTN